MMTLRHDDMMERSPLPPQAGNTRLSYNDRGAYWESSGRRNEKMMIGGRANSMSPPLGVSSKNGGGLLPPRHTNVSQSAPGRYSKAISASMLSGVAKTEHSHPLGMVVSTHFRCGKGVKRGLKNGALPFTID